MNRLRQYIRKTLKESYSPRYRYVYHGTTELAGEQIEDHGFDTSLVGKKSGDKENKGISFTVDKDIATEHAIWAWSQDQKDGAAIVSARISGLNIMKGSEFNFLWDELTSAHFALDAAKDMGYDGVEYFDLESGDGIEEMEVLLFPHAVEVYNISYIDPEDFPDIVENYV